MLPLYGFSHRFPELTAGSKLRGGTKLRVPKKASAKEQKQQAQNARPDGLPPVYVAAENETPRTIAAKLGVDVKALVRLNQRFLKGLTQHARLKGPCRFKSPLVMWRAFAWLHGGGLLMGLLCCLQLCAANSKLRLPGVGDEAPTSDDWKLFGDVVGYRRFSALFSSECLFTKNNASKYAE
eukprot:COSAG05_NODE_716_length_7804_cov_2.669825_13_plen_181_part_00